MINMAKPCIGEEEINAITEVLKSGVLAHGKVVEEFEQQFADYIGTKYAVMVNSGTAALYLALLAHGIGNGDEVITTPFSFIATANAICMTGAIPVFVDIGADFNINADIVEDYITRRTVAILPVHLYGKPCNMDKLTEICYKHKLHLIEDCCQAHGATYDKKKVGGFGAGCFSFYPTKNMTTGEGGMITTNVTYVAEKARKLRNHGQFERYNSDAVGGNYRGNNMSAAIGIEQLKKLDLMNRKRWENAKEYSRNLYDVPGILLPKYKFSDTEFGEHVFHQYTIRVTEKFPVSRYILKEALLNQGIATEVYYPTSIIEQKYFKDHCSSKKYAKIATEQVLSLPVHPSLFPVEIQKVCNEIRSIGGIN